MKANLMIARFPYGHREHDAIAEWLVGTVAKAKADNRIDQVRRFKESDTPITMLRNRALLQCKQQDVDFCLMIDNDVNPDAYLATDVNAKPFFETALDLLWNHEGPCIAAAPYCGPPPHEVPFAFKWANRQSDHPNIDTKLEILSREEAAGRTGIEEMPALPTGLILIDVRIIEHLPPPWFEYEYLDPPFNTIKCTTEDVFFTRNAGLAGFPQYMLWDCWCGHFKEKEVGRPVALTNDAVRKEYRDSVAGNNRSDRKIRFQDHKEQKLKELQNGELAPGVLMLKGD